LIDELTSSIAIFVAFSDCWALVRHSKNMYIKGFS